MNRPWESMIAMQQGQPPIGAIQQVTYYWKRRDPMKWVIF